MARQRAREEAERVRVAAAAAAGTIPASSTAGQTAAAVRQLDEFMSAHDDDISCEGDDAMSQATGLLRL